MTHSRRFLYGLTGWLWMMLALVIPEASGNVNIDLKRFELPNGMLFLIVERHTTPQVACRLSIRAGSALEENGKTGIAHLLEHMMFKGTKNFGSMDYLKDQQLQEQIEAAYQSVLEEERKREPDRRRIRENLAEMERLRREVQKIYVPQAFSSQLGRNGAVDVNAFTTKDQTQYTVSVPSDMLEQWFAITSEQLFEPSWREFYVEKEVVQREWAYRYVNNPSGAAWMDLFATAYRAHPYRNPTIGWRSDMDHYNTSDAMAYHRKYYHPANAVLVLVGDVDITQVKRLANTYFARYPAGARATETVTREPAQNGPRRSVRLFKGARTPLVRIGFHGAPMGTKDFYALDALTMVLSHGRGARLIQNIVNKGRAQRAWAYNPDNRYGGMVILGGSPNAPPIARETTPEPAQLKAAYLEACRELEQMVLTEANQLKKELVSEATLKRIKKLNQRDFLDRLRSNGSLARILATLEVQIGAQYLTTYLAQMDAVTPLDIRRVANRYLTEDKMTSVYVIPGGTPDQPPVTYNEDRSAKGAVARNNRHHWTVENRSVFPTPEGWRHPLSFERKPQRVVYPNAHQSSLEGATVFYLPDRELPLIDLSLMVKAGAVDVPPSKAGLAELLSGTWIRGGTLSHTPGELAVVLDRDAIQLSISVGEESTAVRLSVMKEDWSKGLELLREILTEPAFNEAIVAATKQQFLAGLDRQRDDAQAVAMRESKVLYFRNHPYGRDPLLAKETLPAISTSDLKQFIHRYFKPANMVAAVSGDISETEALEGLQTVLKALGDGSAPTRQLTDPQSGAPQLVMVHKPGQAQSQVVMYLPSVKRTHPDFWKINMLMHVFGGSDSLMYTRLRDDLGLVYSAGFYQTYKWQAGMAVGYIGCRGDRTRQAIEETLNIMRVLKKDGLSKEDLEQKRLDTLNSFVFNVDSPGELVDVYSRYHMRGEPLDTLDKIQQSFISATKEELEQLAQQVLDEKKVQIVVVGDKTLPVSSPQGQQLSLEADLQALARTLQMPYKELPLR